MALRVIVTGKNEEIARDICSHLLADRGLKVTKCIPSREALIDAISVDMPQVVIICLSYENPYSVSLYDVLAGSTGPGRMRVIVVANPADKSSFMSYTRIDHMYFLARPVSILALYRQLDAVESEFSRLADNDVESSEFTNPRAVAKVRRKHILVIDDDSMQLMQTKAHLSDFFDVTLVTSGKAALKFLEKRETDLILLDYLMPDMNGPQVLNKLREDPKTAGIPVIFLTGVNEKGAVIRTLTQLKPAGYVVKPARQSTLVAKILDILEEQAENGIPDELKLYGRDGSAADDAGSSEEEGERDIDPENDMEPVFEPIDPADMESGDGLSDDIIDLGNPMMSFP